MTSNPFNPQKQNHFDNLRTRLVGHSDVNHGIGVMGRTLDIFSAATFASQDRIVDVITALPKINRYTGQTIHPYSVAQHSLVLTRWAATEAEVLEPHLLLGVLLHDAAEAFIGDIIRPIKRMVKGDIRELEDQILSGIYVVALEEEELVMDVVHPTFQEWLHHSDTQLAATEALVLQKNDILPHYDKLTLPEDSFAYHPWDAVETRFGAAITSLMELTRTTPKITVEQANRLLTI